MFHWLTINVNDSDRTFDIHEMIFYRDYRAINSLNISSYITVFASREIRIS